jgi:hypothetical protein
MDISSPGQGRKFGPITHSIDPSRSTKKAEILFYRGLANSQEEITSSISLC